MGDKLKTIQVVIAAVKSLGVSMKEAASAFNAFNDSDPMLKIVKRERYIERYRRRGEQRKKR